MIRKPISTIEKINAELAISDLIAAFDTIQDLSDGQRNYLSEICDMVVSDAFTGTSYDPCDRVWTLDEACVIDLIQKLWLRKQ